MENKVSTGTRVQLGQEPRSWAMEARAVAHCNRP
jgi:hypothetical protein